MSSKCARPPDYLGLQALVFALVAAAWPGVAALGLLVLILPGFVGHKEWRQGE
jgi:hypothetical protein